MKYLRVLAQFALPPVLFTIAALGQLPQCADQGTWSTYKFADSSGQQIPMGTPLLLTDGTVMLQYTGNQVPAGNQLQDWYRLTPDSNGCYGIGNGCNATLTKLASLANVWQKPQYAPSAMSSAVLADGKVIIEGGEYNMCQCNRIGRCESDTTISCGQCVGGVGRCFTTMGALYDPLKDTWTPVQPPKDRYGYTWNSIGDAPAAVLPDKTFLMGNACSSQTALFNEAELSWEASGDQQAFGSEESYTQLPDGTMLAVDTCWPGQPCMNYGDGFNSEAYHPATQTWSTRGDTPVRLYGYGVDQANSCTATSPIFGEQGPAALRPDGTYFATGALTYGPTFNFVTHTATYNTVTRQWVRSPDLPEVTFTSGTYPLFNNDQGAVVLPDGNMMLVTFPNGPPNFNVLIEWDGSSYCRVGDKPEQMGAQYETLLLPSGQVMFVPFNYYWVSPYYFIYTPGGQAYPGIAPTVNEFPDAMLFRGRTYTVSGTRFGGYSSGSVFGDDFENYTNYPLVRITNDTSGHIFYARTHDHSTMAVFTGDTPTYTKMDVPSEMETGPSHLVVVTNGIPSNAVRVNIQ